MQLLNAKTTRAQRATNLIPTYKMQFSLPLPSLPIRNLFELSQVFLLHSLECRELVVEAMVNWGEILILFNVKVRNQEIPVILQL